MCYVGIAQPQYGQGRGVVSTAIVYLDKISIENSSATESKGIAASAPVRDAAFTGEVYERVQS